VRAAIESLTDGGFARATTAVIASKAGMTTGALHHHFPVKESLFLAVLDELTEQALVLFKRLGANAKGSKSLPRAIVTDLWSLYGSKQYWAVWEINMGYRGDEAMHRTLVEHRNKTRERMRQTLLANEHLDLPTKQVLLGSLPFLLSAMRGAFLDTFFTASDSEALRPQLDSLVSYLSERLGVPARTRGKEDELLRHEEGSLA
jgi:AcrR family transcriptional regulator